MLNLHPIVIAAAVAGYFPTSFGHWFFLKYPILPMLAYERLYLEKNYTSYLHTKAVLSFAGDTKAGNTKQKHRAANRLL